MVRRRSPGRMRRDLISLVMWAVATAVLWAWLGATLFTWALLVGLVLGAGFYAVMVITRRRA
jgi:hypothetical protein